MSEVDGFFRFPEKKRGEKSPVMNNRVVSKLVKKGKWPASWR